MNYLKRGFFIQAVSYVVCLSEGLMVPNVYMVEEDLVLEAGVDDGSGVLMAFLSVRFFKRYVEGNAG